MKDKHGKVIYEPYRIKVLNTINFRKSMHYNPFAYIHSEKDILKLVTTLIANTKGEGKAGDDFWVKAGGRDLLQFRWAFRSPGVWRSGADWVYPL